MTAKKFVFILIPVFLLLFCIGCSLYLDNKPFYSPEKGDMTVSEWYDACQIPDSKLSQMTTDTLVRSIADSPFPIELGLLSASSKENYDNVKQYYNGFRELENRLNALQILTKLQAEFNG